MEADTIIETLIAQTQGTDVLSKFASIWTSDKFRIKHIAKRVASGEVVDEFDYAKKTFEVMARADTMTLVDPVNQSLRVTGKIQIEIDGWVVLISEEGKIVTSYPAYPNLQSFEKRHQENGDFVYEKQIDRKYRAILAQLFGNG